jgi:CBS-domain-containing membrane protein
MSPRAACRLATLGYDVYDYASQYRFALALAPGRVVFGRVRRSRLADAGASVEALLEPGPSTIRPHTSIEDLAARLARSEVRTLIVTDPEGKLLGVVRRGDVDGSH